MISARKRPSAAMVVALAGAAMALAALVVSMAGTATGLPGKNRIDRNDLRKRVVKRINIQRNAVRGFHVNEATLGQVPNADTVDGRDASCPTGMTPIEGLCYDAANRGDNDWNDARADCADENASLPTIGQLQLAIDELGNLDGDGEWTDSFHTHDGVNPRAGVLSSDGSILAVLDGSPDVAYRCVRPLVR